MKSKKNTIYKISTKELVAQKNFEELRNNPRNPILVILDNIRSMHNVGAIFRTCDATKVEKLYLCGITATPPRKEIDKTALRTVDFVPWEYRANASELVNELKSVNVQIIAVEQTNTSVKYTEFKYKKPVAIILGNEVNGVSDELLKLCDNAVEIPMQGSANSLNVATATGVILYHINSYHGN